MKTDSIFNAGEEIRNLSPSRFQRGTYENCTFTDCDLTDTALSDSSFIECIFRGCNLSLSKLTGAVVVQATFEECKLLGLHFDDCKKSGFSAKFSSCNISLVSFINISLRKTSFVSCRIDECDFSGADLTESVFDSCSFERSVFNGTKLAGTDFRTSTGYSIDPEANLIRGALFSLPSVLGLLDKYEIVIEK